MPPHASFPSMLSWFLALSLVSAGPSYADQAKAAKPISSLGRFLEGFLGDCVSKEPEFDEKACLKKAKRRRKLHGRRLLRLSMDDVSEQVAGVKWDRRRKAYRMMLTPIFGAHGFGLSIGTPRKLNASGLPVVRNVPIWVEKPSEEPDFAFRRSLGRGMVRVEFLLAPGGVWDLRKGKVRARGLTTRLIGYRVWNSRGDQVLAEQVF